MRFAAPPRRGTAPASLPGSGPKRPRGETCLSMGSDWWRRARRAPCPGEEERLWTISGAGGPPPMEEIFIVFSSQGRAPSLDEGSLYWAEHGSRVRAERAPCPFNVRFAPSPYTPGEGLCVVPRSVGGGCWWARLLRQSCMAPCPALSLAHWRVLVPVKVAAR